MSSAKINSALGLMVAEPVVLCRIPLAAGHLSFSMFRTQTALQQTGQI